MQVDWEVEIGGEAPVIDSRWAGFVDLRETPGKAASLPESAQLPALAAALVQLNAQASSLWTSKCDVWPVLEFDRDEMDAPPQAAEAMACYVDLLPRDSSEWLDPQDAVVWCKDLCTRLSRIPLSSCRADLIVRRVVFSPQERAIGLTAYLTACGDTAQSAVARLENAVTVFADTASRLAVRGRVESSLQWKGGGE
jgi:hypothetical protein